MSENEFILLGKYAAYLQEKKCIYDTIGRKMRNIHDFLNKGYEVSKNGYKDYAKNGFRQDINENIEETRSDIIDFLQFNKVGYFRKSNIKKNKSKIEKLSDISNKNAQLLNEFRAHLINNTKFTSSTIISYSNCVKQYFKYCNNFSKDEYKRYINHLENTGVCAAGICAKIAGLNSLAIYLKKPDYKLVMPKVQRKLELNNIFSEKEYYKLLDYLMGKGKFTEYYQVKIMATTGARISEFLQFDWEHLENGYIELKGKGNKYRKFLFNKNLAKEMSLYAKKNNLKGAIFLTKRQIRMKQRSVTYKLKFWAKKAGLDVTKFYPHAFRHFFAKMYLKKNKDVVQLSNLLGHESVDVTRIYLMKTLEEQIKDFNNTVNW